MALTDLTQREVLIRCIQIFFKSRNSAGITCRFSPSQKADWHADACRLVRLYSAKIREIDSSNGK